MNCGYVPREWVLTCIVASPILIPLIGLYVTNFRCPACGGMFCSSNFFGMPNYDSALFWVGIFPWRCAICETRVGTPLYPKSDP